MPRATVDPALIAPPAPPPQLSPLQLMIARLDSLPVDGKADQVELLMTALSAVETWAMGTNPADVFIRKVAQHARERVLATQARGNKGTVIVGRGTN